MTIYLQSIDAELCCVHKCACGPTGKNLKQWISKNKGIALIDLVVYYNGKIVQEDDELEEDGVYHVSLRLRGGKGGFGSMLRRIGAQIEKTTNHEACRDLSGRRMRDVNNEKKLADWISKQAEKEAEREEKRQAKLERMRSGPRHMFVDPSYDKQKKEVIENLDDAITAGLEASADVPSSSGIKRKVIEEDDDDDDDPKAAKLWNWAGVNDVNSESDDNEDALPEKETNDNVSHIQENETTPQLPESEKTIISETMKECSKSYTQAIIKGNLSNGEEKHLINSEDGSGATTLTKEAKPSLLEMLPPPCQENKKNTKQLVLDEVTSVKELETFGLEVLKEELMNRGLKCGGTLQERAARLYSVKGLEPDQIELSIKAKPTKKKKK